MDAPRFLTTKEVADLLRAKERKVYDLAAAGEIPHRRVTGKLLFERAEIEAWLGADTAVRPDVLTGSHDPLLDWVVRESGADLAMLLNGSGAGLSAFGAGRAALTGLHVPCQGDWNIAAVADLSMRDCVLVAFATRARGLMSRTDTPVASLADLNGGTLARRPDGTGAQTLLLEILAQDGLPIDMATTGPLCHTENDAAMSVADRSSDGALGLQATAHPFGLAFHPLVQERFDLLIDRRAYFTPPVQRLLGFAQTQAFQDKADALTGYDISELGSVRWLSP